jgi:nitroreductase/NAD-dependent dihydropyrimidine dehydrogenase PreA subunit
MNEWSIHFDSEKCTKDGLCSNVCPTRIIAWEKNGVPKVSNSASCVLCGHCMAVCSRDAVSHSGLERSRFTSIVNSKPIDTDVAEAFLKQRRSLRVYKKDLVPRDLLERIASVAGYAPTGAHGSESQNRGVTIVSGPEAMKRVLELTAHYLQDMRKLLDSFMVRMASRFNLEARRGRLMLDDLDMRLNELQKGQDVITYMAPAAMFVHVPRLTPTPQEDCDGALMMIMFAAQANGLGTCWNGWLSHAASAFQTKDRVFRKFIKLPEDHDVYAAATIGYPAVKMRNLPDRRVNIRYFEK